MENITEDEKYKNFVIYKIYPINDETNIYIGSTTNFSRRKSQHKKNTTNKRIKRYYTPLYQFIRALGGFDNFKMEILEKYPCNNKQEGLTKERELIELYGANINVNKPI